MKKRKKSDVFESSDFLKEERAVQLSPRKGLKKYAKLS